MLSVLVMILLLASAFLAAWLVGFIGDHHGLRAAFLILPSLFLPLIACILVERCRGVRSAVALR